MRILHCIPSLGVGGAERQLSVLATAQARRGLDVHVAAIYDGPRLLDLETGGVVVHRIRAFGNHDPIIGFRLSALIQRIQPDLVQSWLPQMDVFAGLAAKAMSRKWVLSERVMGAAFQSRFKDRVLRVGLGKWADAIVANSEAGLEYWSGKVREQTILRVVPNALALDRIEDARPVQPFPDYALVGDPVVLFAGRFAPQKNPLILLQALATIMRERNVRAFFCGEGPLRNDMVAIANELGLRERALISPPRDDLWGLMKSAAALVSPSRYEGHPNVVLEAAAAGCPLVLSDIPSHRAVANESAAVFFNPDSPEELARALLHVLNDRPASDRRSEKAALSVQAYSAARSADGYQSVYNLLVQRG